MTLRLRAQDPIARVYADLKPTLPLYKKDVVVSGVATAMEDRFDALLDQVQSDPNETLHRVAAYRILQDAHDKLAELSQRMPDFIDARMMGDFSAELKALQPILQPTIPPAPQAMSPEAMGTAFRVSEPHIPPPSQPPPSVEDVRAISSLPPAQHLVTLRSIIRNATTQMGIVRIVRGDEGVEGSIVMVMANKKVVEESGFTEAELCSRDFIMRNMHPNFRPMFGAAVDMIARDRQGVLPIQLKIKKPGETESEIATEEDDYREFNLHVWFLDEDGGALSSYAVYQLFDNSEQQKAAQELRKAYEELAVANAEKERFQEWMMNAGAWSVIEVNQEGELIVEFTSPAFEQLLKYESGTLQRAKLRDMLAPVLVQDAQSSFDTFLKNLRRILLRGDAADSKAQDVTISVRRQDGREIPLDLKMDRGETKGHPFVILHYGDARLRILKEEQDIELREQKAQRRVADEIASDVNNNVQAVTGHLGRASTFATVLNEALNNPDPDRAGFALDLAAKRLRSGRPHDEEGLQRAIDSRNPFLLAAAINREIRGSIDLANRQAEQISKEISDLRDWQTAPKNIRVTSLSFMLDTEDIRAQITDPSIVIKTELQANPGYVNVDPRWFSRILARLIDSAVQRMSESAQRELTVKSAVVALTDEGVERLPNLVNQGNAHAGSYVVLSIADTGPGIRALNVKDIFRIGDSHLTPMLRETGHRGRRLALVRSIVDEFKGFITIENTVGLGTTFHVWFPEMQPPDNTYRPQTLSGEWDIRSIDFSKLKRP